MGRRGRRAALVVWLALAPACGLPRHVPAAPAGDPAAAARAAEWLARAYPERCRMTHRVVVTLSGRQIDFLGAFVLSRGEGLRALGLSEMGGKVFDLVAAEDRRLVLLKPEALSERPLLDGAIGDLLHIYAGHASALAGQARAAHGAGGEPVVVDAAGGRTAEYVLDAGGAFAVRSLEAVDGRVRRVVRYGDHRLQPGHDRPLPRRIVCENLEFGYLLEIELLDIEPIAEAGEALAPARAP